MATSLYGGCGGLQLQCELPVAPCCALQSWRHHRSHRVADRPTIHRHTSQCYSQHRRNCRHGAYIIFALIFCAKNMVTTSSRQLFSFARENGLPYSAWLVKVSPERRIPTNAIICTACFTLILSAILAGSPRAFNIIASLGAAAILSSYVVSIGTITYRRLKGSKLLKTQFSLGRFAMPINILALGFVSFAWILAFFPASPSPMRNR